ncbi:MAG: hypothetical protein HY774_01925 [Acidobacteria bacterium]|nr:hypothetical protein [Acidobacteriota bacterium]
MLQHKFGGNRVRVLALLLCVIGLAGLYFGLVALDLSRSASSAKAQTFILDVPIQPGPGFATYKNWYRLTEEPTFVPKARRTG